VDKLAPALQLTMIYGVIDDRNSVIKTITLWVLQVLSPHPAIYLIDNYHYFYQWHALSIQYCMQKGKSENPMNKREIIRTLILSPLYWKLKLKDRAMLIRKMIPRKPL
jgi:hypothetical protein